MTLLTRGILLSVLGLTACGDSGPAPYTLTLLGDRVSYVAAQDGDGAWQQIAFDASGMATFEVTRGYHGLAVVCVRLLIVRYDAGADEPLAPCATVTSSQISGTVMPATATVWGQRGLGDSTNGTYRVRTSQGRRDLVALADDRVLFQRDLQIDADRTIDLDVSAAGVPLTTLTPIVSGNGAESFRAYAEILTVNGTYAETSSGTFAVVPSAQRVPGDRVAIGAQITIGGSVQTVQREQINELAPSLTFEPLPHLAIDRAGMQWDPEWDFAATQYGGTTYLHTTAAWAAASGASVAPLVDGPSLPGWDVTLTLPWPQAGAAVPAVVWAGVGDISGDYRANHIETTLTW